MSGPVQIVVALGLVLVAVGLVALARSRRTARRELVTARAETEQLRARLDTLEERLESASAALVETRDAFLITDAGVERPEPTVPDRVVLSATFGEPLVKVVALGHGLARALSPESRNRIFFEMRREVRRARKQRRRETKQAWRAMRAEERRADAA